MNISEFKIEVVELFDLLLSIEPTGLINNHQCHGSSIDLLSAMAPFLISASLHDGAVDRPRTSDDLLVDIQELSLRAPLLKVRRIREILHKIAESPEELPGVVVNSESRMPGTIEKADNGTSLKIWIDHREAEGCWFKAFVEKGSKSIELASMSLGLILQEIEFALQTNIEHLIPSFEIESLIRLHLQALDTHNLRIDGDDYSEFMIFVKDVRNAWKDSRPAVVRQLAMGFPADHAYRLATIFDAMRLGDNHSLRVLSDLVPGYAVSRRFSMSNLIRDDGVQLFLDQNLLRTQLPRKLSVLSSLQEFKDFGSRKSCWRFIGEFTPGNRGSFVIEDSALVKAFPEHINSVWGKFALLYGEKVFVIDDIA